MTTLPSWAVWALSFGSPALVFIGVLIGQAITLRNAKELEMRSKREEVMRILRWAAEIAASDNEALARQGVAQLGALLRSDMLDDSQKDFVHAALAAVVKEPAQQIEQFGENVQVIPTTDPVAGTKVDIASEAETKKAAADDG